MGDEVPIVPDGVIGKKPDRCLAHSDRKTCDANQRCKHRGQPRVVVADVRKLVRNHPFDLALVQQLQESSSDLATHARVIVFVASTLVASGGFVIHVQDLVKTFGEIKAVDHVSFDVAEGEIFAFLGPNGAGKTTTIQMLTTLLAPTSGTIAIDGIDPRSRPHDVRRRFGIVFQDPSLDGELTAYENMELHGVLYHVPRRTRIERIERLLTLFELWDRRDGFVKTFSGGMKRRLEIARGLPHTPKILFLDEPTLGLDPQSRNQLSGPTSNT